MSSKKKKQPVAKQDVTGKKKKKDASAEEKFEGVENLLTRTERYIEENQKSLTFIVLAIIVVVFGYIGYRQLYVAPMEEEASSRMHMAERYFEADSFQLALYGDNANYGFLDIIDNYGVTQTANLAKYYAGISFLHLGEYEDAIAHLSRFHSRDEYLSAIAIGAMGDAYIELGETGEAASMYSKAANRRDNVFTSPLYFKKAGLAYEELGKYDKALEMFQTILDEYPESNEADDARKYVGRVKTRLER